MFLFPLIRQASDGSAANIYQECRKALETRLSTATALSGVTIGWPNRPVTIPASAVWVRVQGIRWRGAVPALMGGTTAKGVRRGEFTVDIIGRAGAGYGPLNDMADSVRDRFNRVTLSTPSQLQLWCLAPSGPTPQAEKGFARVSVRIPFLVSETVPN